MTALIDEHGITAYGFYWLLTEVIAESMDKTDRCELTHSVSQWARLLFCHHHAVKKYFAALSKPVYPTVTQELPGSYPTSNSLVTLEYDGSNVTVKIPNLLKYRDEYSKRSGQTPEQLPTKIEIENIDKKEPPIVPLAGDVSILESQSINENETAAQSKPQARSKTKRTSPTMTVQQREAFMEFMNEHPKGNLQVVYAENLWAEKVTDQVITAFVMDCLRREKTGDLTYMLGPWKWLRDHLAMYANGIGASKGDKEQKTPEQISAKEAEYNAKYAHLLRPIWEEAPKA